LYDGKYGSIVQVYYWRISNENKTVLFAVLGFLLVTAAACSSQVVVAGNPDLAAGMDEEMEVQLSISNFQYQPGNLEVKVGTIVTWTNMDTVEHTVTSDDGLFDSGLLGKDATFSYTFEQAGSYPYYSIPHPNMVATVTVVD
jgi:plastocyanin